jgi:hypothetical protein
MAWTAFWSVGRDAWDPNAVYVNIRECRCCLLLPLVVDAA